jgi:HSP20 family protein
LTPINSGRGRAAAAGDADDGIAAHELSWINVSAEPRGHDGAWVILTRFLTTMMETMMADVPVEVKKAPAAEAPLPDVWRSFRSEMDRLFDRFGFPSLRRMFDIEPAWRSVSTFGFSVPPIDMSEDDKAYKIMAELPGLDAKDVDVSISGNTLVLKGEKRQEKEEKDKNYYFSERAYGSFQRAFEVPASVERNEIAAEFTKGVLTITLPKTRDAQRQPKKIEVKSS